VDTTSGSRATSRLGAGSATLWDDLDLLAGARPGICRSENDPSRARRSSTAPRGRFHSTVLRPRTIRRAARSYGPGTIFSDRSSASPCRSSVTGLVDLDDEASSLINGKIDEDRILPSYGFTYRALEGLNIRGAYSQTVARPSFREMGYYVSVEPGSDDLIIGNPQMKLSDVESFDARIEYVWGELGDLGAVSGFYKTVEDPIESIIVRNPADFSGSGSALYRTFFNNPNQATLWGLELEGRKNLGVLGPELAQYFSIGGNYTYI
jgi:outer membrane receptor protein involved in Fe transport